MAAEKNFENKIKKLLEEEKIWFVKYWGGGMYTKAGVPDILACVNGHFLALEVKSQIGKPTELQKRQIELIRQSGGFSASIHPENFESLKILITYLKGK